MIGLGYVGFPLACVIGKSGKYRVYGFDMDEKKTDLIRKGKSPVQYGLVFMMDGTAFVGRFAPPWGPEGLNGFISHLRFFKSRTLSSSSASRSRSELS